MIPAPLPHNEPQRLEALHATGVLDTLPESAYDDIAHLASQLCGTPMALISLVDAKRQWFKSRVGIQATQTSRELAFCAYTILQPDDVLLIPDARTDVRFSSNPYVAEHGLCFYAGAPIVNAEGLALGTVCAVDFVPHQLEAEQVAGLRALARLTAMLLERDRRAREEAQREAQARLREQQRELEVLTAIATRALDLKAFLDRDFVYRYVNDTYLHYWQKQREEIIGHSVPELMGQAVFDARVRPLLERTLRGEVIEYEAEFDFPGRGKRLTEVAYLPAKDTQGNIIGAVVRVHDIDKLTQRERMLAASVAQLEEKAVAQERFIHILSHDLREPVNTIVNFSSLLGEDEYALVHAGGRDYIERVHGAGKRMRALLDGLIELVRMDQLTPDCALVDLGELAGQVRADLAFAIGGCAACIDIEALPMVAGEPHLLRVLLQNLVANGIKFRRPGESPSVRVSAVSAQHAGLPALELRVADNGIGIPGEQLDHIFELFRRLHTRRAYEGSGLGLAICKRIAELHGGRIWASSVPGTGSTFHVVLPLACPSPAPAPAEKGAQPPPLAEQLMRSVEIAARNGMQITPASQALMDTEALPPLHAAGAAVPHPAPAGAVPANVSERP